MLITKYRQFVIPAKAGIQSLGGGETVSLARGHCRQHGHVLAGFRILDSRLRGSDVRTNPRPSHTALREIGIAGEAG